VSSTSMCRQETASAVAAQLCGLQLSVVAAVAASCCFAAVSS
jgi:hypothetical protein